MNKRLYIILGSIVVLAIIISMVSPKKIDWSSTYNENNTNPFDLKVFYEQLDDIYTESSIYKIRTTFYEYWNEKPMLTFKKNNLYINIDNQFQPDESSENKLLEFIGKGNIAFISANSFSKPLLDSLKMTSLYKTDNINTFENPEVTLQFKKNKNTLVHQPKLKYRQTSFKDSTNYTKLGTSTFSIKENTKQVTNFIEVSYKKGYFYLHTNPEIFTNYELLKADNTNYLNQILSYIPTSIVQNNSFQVITAQNIYFESNFKRDPDLANSPLRFIKKQKELNMAWNILLITAALFLIFNAKRRQRIIPIIAPVRNTSLDYIETISSLYEDSENFQPIIKHKIHIFYKDLRSLYHLKTDATNTKLAKQLSLKSGYPLQNTKELLRFIDTIKNRETSSISLLNKLEKDIDTFHKKSNLWMN